MTRPEGKSAGSDRALAASNRILREALRRSEMNARDLARRTGISEGRISDYLSGRHQPSAGRLLELLSALGFDVALRPNFDRNGILLGQLLDLADAVSVDPDRPRRRAEPPTFRQLVSRHAG